MCYLPRCIFKIPLKPSSPHLYSYTERTPLQHAAELTKYLRDTLNCIDRSQGQTVPADVVRTIVTATLTLISKTIRTPDFITAQDALNIMQTEVRTRAEETAKSIETLRVELGNNAADIKQSNTVGEETEAAAQEVREG
jgi:hypothetical protein